MQIIKPDINIDFLGKRKLFLGLSGAVLAISLTSLATVGLNFGIDFTGGSELQLAFKQDPGAAAVRKAVEAIGFVGPEVQQFGEQEGRTDYLVRIREQVTLIDASKGAAVRKALEDQAATLGALKQFEPADSGDKIYLKFDKTSDPEAITKILDDHDLKEAKVEQTGHPQDFSYVATLQEIQGKITADLRAKFGADFDQVTRAQIVGPKAGKRLRNDGALSVLVALGAILMYIAVRFDFRFAPGAIAALLHDIVVTLGVFSVFSHWLEFSLPTIAALLTIVGYSLNDTIVVFDRIRENFDYSREKDLTKLVNQSINETLSRTLLTSLTTLFVVAALFVWGGGLIRDFAAALLCGVVVGTYSSVAVASPMVLKMDEILPQLQEWFLPASAGAGAGKGGKKGAAARTGA